MGKLQLKSISTSIVLHPTSWTDENMKNIHKIINKNVWRTISKLTGILGLLHGAFQQILRQDLNTHWILEEYVTTGCSPSRGSSMCLRASNCFKNDYNFLFSAITGDETWIYCYNLEAKQQSSHWKKPILSTSKESKASWVKITEHTGDIFSLTKYCSLGIWSSRPNY